VPHTLLLADDSVTIQRVIELTFADEDVQVIAVSDGDQAIERLKASPPDIVLADIGMPGKNGYEVAQFMRQTPALAHIPVVLLTGAFEPVDQERAARAGCDGVLAKPFEPQLVISRVKELLARRHGDGDAAPPQTPVQAEHWAAAGVNESPAAAPPAALDDYFDRLDAAFSSLNAPAEPQKTTAAAPAPAAAPETDIDWFSAAPAKDVTPDGWDLPSMPAKTAVPTVPLTYAAPAPPPVEAPQPFESAVPFEPPAAFEPVAFEPTGFEAPVPQPSVGVPDPFGDPAHAAFAAEWSYEPDNLAPSAVAAAAVEQPAAPAATRAAAPSRPAAAAPATLPVVSSLPPLADAFAALLAAEAHDGSRGAPLAWPITEPAAPVVTDDVIEEIARRVLDRLSDRVVRETVADTVSRVAEQLVRDEIERIKASIK
jgi:CheY-like chemotaxis protein